MIERGRTEKGEKGRGKGEGREGEEKGKERKGKGKEKGREASEAPIFHQYDAPCLEIVRLTAHTSLHCSAG